MDALEKASGITLAGIGTQQKASKNTGGPARSASTPLARHCEAEGVEIARFASVNTDDFRGMMQDLGVEMLVVASFGQILKPALLALPCFGCLNVHASLLPRYRGASPIVASLLNGDAKTGVTFMQMEAGLDTGPIYRTCELDILPEDDSYSLEQRLGELAACSIESVIIDIARKGLMPAPQPAEGASYAKKISKEDGLADWRKSALELANMVRAYRPWPSLRTRMPARGDKSKIVKITDAVVSEACSAGAKPGSIVGCSREGIVVACGGNTSLLIRRVTPEGRKDMSAADFLLGSPIPPEHAYMYEFSVGD